MISNRLVLTLYASVCFLFKINAAVAQAAPNISYTTPQYYTVNKVIAPLVPVNKGGAVPNTQYGFVSTFAGDYLKTSVDGPASAASFRAPTNITSDYTGNLFISDQSDGSVRKIDKNGVVSTIARNLNAPSGLAVDKNNNVYVAEANSHLISKISPANVVTVFAGSGLMGSTDGTAVGASFNEPSGIAIDAVGNLYVADLGNNTIRKITPAGMVNTIAGSASNSGSSDGTGASASFYAPHGITVGPDGNIIVVELLNDLVRRITPAGVVTTIAGKIGGGSNNGLGSAAGFSYPQGVAVDASGNMYIADAENNLIRKVTSAGLVTTLAGNGNRDSTNAIGTAAGFDGPTDVAISPDGNLYVADDNNAVIRKIALGNYTIDKALPPGLTFDATTGTISGTPTASWPATSYNVTAYNAGGSSATTLSIEVDEETIAFGPLPQKTVCDADFDPGAVSNSPITYSTDNPAVATIVSGKIHITGPGTAVITASDGTSHATRTLTVIGSVMPTIAVSPVSLDDCQGATVTFTAEIANGGTNPAYQWQVNGQNVGINSPQFTSSTLNNNDKITCMLTSNAFCTTSPTVTSNSASFIVDPPFTTSITIASSLTGPVCAGTDIVFTATPTSSDNKPTYQWQVNGQNAGTNATTFTSTHLADGDVVTCILTSTGKCLVNPSATSNGITVHLMPVSACVIVVPNTFTPNGDGINDLWNITALHGYPDCLVTIFNRYGTLVYNSTGYVKAWDGNYNGSALPVGTYYFIIDLKNGRKKIGGSVTILR